MRKQISNTVLMTAAGYTKNFGGLLADQMWAEIFNHKDVQDKPALRNLLFDTFDYELVYHEVCNDDDTDSEKKTYKIDEKEAIRAAILKAYETLDVIAQKYIPVRDDSKLNILNGAKKVIDCLTRDMSHINFFFTLNQDIFVERLISDTKKSIMWPGIGKKFFIPNSLDSSLRLYIISPVKPREFVKELSKEKYIYGKRILKGLSGYFEASFKNIFPPDGSDTHTWKELQETFFSD